MKYNESVERHAPRLGLNNLVTGEPSKPFVYMDYVDDGMWVHYVTYCENIRKQKRKRCLAMAKAFDKYAFALELQGHGRSTELLKRHNRAIERKYKWLELADKYSV